jgi:hypothetical protein
MVSLPAIYSIIGSLLILISFVLFLLTLRSKNNQETFFVFSIAIFFAGFCFIVRASDLLEISYKYTLMEDATKIAIAKI